MNKELSALKKAQKLGAEKAQSLNKALRQSVTVIKKRTGYFYIT